MKLEKLLELAKENYYLHETTYLPRIPETAFRKKLTEYYNSELEEVRLMGSVLNSIYTEGKTTFYFSKRSVEKLIENDRKNLENKGRPKISLGKDGHKVNYFRQRLVQMFKDCDEFNLLKEASIKFKTPSVVDFDDDVLYNMMDEFGDMTKRLRKSFKKTALDSILLIEKEMMESEAETAKDTSSVQEEKPLKILPNKQSSVKPEEIDVSVDLSMGNDDWIYDHMQSLS